MSKITYCLTGCFLFLSLTVSAQCPGDQTTYGNEQWIGYVYFGTPWGYSDNPPSNPLATEYYAGYITQTPHFVQDYENSGPSGATVCGNQTDYFAIRYRMRKYYAAGTYTFTVGGDDGFRLSIDGGSTYLVGNWSDHGYGTSSASATLAAGYYNLVLEYYEKGSGAKVSYFDSSCTAYSTAPTNISGTTDICSGNSTILTASGGVSATGSVYQWGYGATAGYNVISGQTGASITISPTQNETVWVRRIDAGTCSNTTSAIKVNLTVMTPSAAPTTISGIATICPGESTTLTASGGATAPGFSYQWGTGTVGTNIIAGQTGSSITVSPGSTTHTGFAERTIRLVRIPTE